MLPGSRVPHRPTRTIVYGSTGTDKNIRTDAGSPVGEFDVVIIVNANIGQSSGTAALRLGTGWTPGCRFFIINNATIEGMGGTGGSGSSGGAAGAGGNGGNAIDADGQSLWIDNTNGNIWGGGGGGGGGGYTNAGGSKKSPTPAVSGGQGGGGAGNVVGTGFNNGTSSAGGGGQTSGVNAGGNGGGPGAVGSGSFN